MFQIEADQFAAMRKHRLAEALAAGLTGDHWRGTVDPASGDVLATDRLDHTSRFGFDQQGYIGTITSPLGRTWQLHNGPGGRLDGLTSPAGTAIGFDYDAAYRRLTGIRRGDGAALRIGYGDSGRPEDLAWPDGSHTRFAFSGKRLTARTNRLGETEHYDWDSAGRLTAITNANGQTTTFTYGEWDRPERATFADGRTERYTYDTTGRLVALADDSGPIARLSYDGDSTRLARIAYADGEVLTFRYDDAGRILAADCPAARTSFTYDATGRLTGEAQDDANVGYDYDARGDLTALRYPDGSAVAFGYDADQRLQRLRDWDGGVSVWDYHDGQTSNLDYANGCIAVTAMDQTGQIANQTLSSPTGTVIAASHYLRDADERLRTSDDRQCGRREYHYDLEGRLLAVAAADPAARERFAYDPAGNRTHCTGATATFDAADRLLTQGETDCRYDARGDLVNITSPRGTWRLTWNRRGLLAAAVSARGERLEFGYDAFGRRMWKRFAGSTAREPCVTRYCWAGEHLIAEFRVQGQRVLHRQEYVFLPGTWTPFATRSDGATCYYHCDPLGTPKRLTDAAGQLIWEADHRAFGEAIITTALVPNPWRLPGQYQDPETGLHYNRFRYYSPELGRYLSRDPLTFFAGTNFFAYVDSDPLNQADPLGLWWKTALSIGLAIAAAAIVIAVAPAALAAAGIVAASAVGVAATTIATGAAAGAVYFAANEALNQEKFCLSCIFSEFLRGGLVGTVGSLAFLALPAEAGVGLFALAGAGAGILSYGTDVATGPNEFSWADLVLTTVISGLTAGLGRYALPRMVTAWRNWRASKPPTPTTSEAYSISALSNKANEALPRAQTAQEDLSPRNIYQNKTVGSDGNKTLSGWKPENVPEGFASAKPSQVAELSDEIGHKLKPSALDNLTKSDGTRDPDAFPGRYYASHAEKQLAVTNPNEPIAVTRPMCKDCFVFYQKLAQSRNSPQVVTDPDVTRVFWPDGTVTLPNGALAPPAQRW